MLQIPHVRLTGDPTNRLPGLAPFAVEGVDGESMVMMLDQNGICTFSGSACSSGSQGASHVLLATELPNQLAHSSPRFSLNEDNSKKDVDYILDRLPVIIAHLQGMSSVWNAIKALAKLLGGFL